MVSPLSQLWRPPETPVKSQVRGGGQYPVLAHEHFRVSGDILWGTISIDIPGLAAVRGLAVGWRHHVGVRRYPLPHHLNR